MMASASKDKDVSLSRVSAHSDSEESLNYLIYQIITIHYYFNIFLKMLGQVKDIAFSMYFSPSSLLLGKRK